MTDYFFLVLKYKKINNDILNTNQINDSNIIHNITKGRSAWTYSKSNEIKEFKIKTEECILKLDAEGVEYDVLNQILDNDIKFKKIYCEFHVHDENHYIEKQNIIKRFQNKNQDIIGTNLSFLSTSLSTFSIYFGARNQTGGPFNFSNKEEAFAFIGNSSLTDIDALNLYNIVQQYQTILNRQV